MRRAVRLILAAYGLVCLVVLLSAYHALWRGAAAGPAGDVIVVLGAGLAEDGTLGPAARARVELGAALRAAGAAPRLIVTDGPVAGPLMARAAVAAGVQTSAIEVDTGAASTLQNALNVARMVEAAGGQRVILVTDKFHMARARASFAWAGVDVSGYAVTRALRPGLWPAAAMTLREALAWPFNLARVVIWQAGGMLGVPLDARYGWLT